MILVDSSVWIDRLRDRDTPQVEALRRESVDDVLVGDLVLMEVLQGARDDRHAALLSRTLSVYEHRALADEETLVATAKNFRTLRSLGRSVRRQIDLIIGTFCILERHHLLYADRDFDIMVQHLGLQPAAGSGPPH